MPKPKRRNWTRVNSQIFVWAGEEPLEIKYSGFRFKVPPRTETAKSKEVDPGTMYRFESARDPKDRLLPGTCKVEDVVRTRPNGGTHRIFDVNECCEFLQRDRPELFEKGFGIVSSYSDVADIMGELTLLYEASQDRRAYTILQTELERQRKMAEKGQVVTERENPEVVEWAMQHLVRRGKVVTPAIGADSIEAVLKGQFQGEIPARKEAEPQAATPPPEERPDNKALFRECEQYGMRLNKREIQALLTDDDPEQIEFIASKLRARKEEAAGEASA